MHPEQFLEAAIDWKESESSNEAYKRSSISRAYYAAFHRCKQTLHKLNIPLPQHKTSHLQVIDALRDSGDKSLRPMAHKLKELKYMREEADYALMTPPPTQNNTLAIRKAQAIIDACDRKLAEKFGT